MRKENLLNRQEAIEKVGAEVMNGLEEMQVDYSHRVMTTGEIEFTSHFLLSEQEKGIDGITAYYYQSKKEHADLVEAEGDLSDMDWSECAGYEVW